MKKKKKKIILIIIIAFLLLSTALIFIFRNSLPREIFPDTSAKKEQIRIACIGDSVTYGATLENRDESNYPKRLGEMLGGNYNVANFGFSGCCVQQSANLPYRNRVIYSQAKSYKPDIVLFMMGSNDTKPKNWEGEEAFKAEYTEFLKEIQSFKSKPEVYILTSPSNFGENDIVNYNISKSNTALVAKIQREVAKEFKLKLVDIYNLTAGKPEWFTDGVHPNAEGAKQIAQYTAMFVK